MVSRWFVFVWTWNSLVLCLYGCDTVGARGCCRTVGSYLVFEAYCQLSMITTSWWSQQYQQLCSQYYPKWWIITPTSNNRLRIVPFPKYLLCISLTKTSISSSHLDYYLFLSTKDEVSHYSFCLEVLPLNLSFLIFK